MRIAKLFGWMMAGAGALGALPGRLVAQQVEAVVSGEPIPAGTAFQRPVTPVAADILWLDNFVLWIIAAISIFVMALLLIVIVRYNHRANPQAASFTHNPTLEVAWTAVPVLILVIIAIPSLRLLFVQLEVPEPDLTIKTTGSQWFWSYEYPDHDISFDAFMIGQGASGLTDEVVDELQEAGYEPQHFRLATDTRVVVPVDKVVHMLVTGSDVIHAWAIPAFGSKIDAIPGVVNETWFRADETGTYFGQCSELCGKDHAYMPIVVEVVSQEEFDDWVQTQQAKNGAAATELAAAE